MSSPNDDDVSAEPLFVTITDDLIIEKDFAGKVGDDNIQQVFQKTMVDQCTFLNRGT